MNNTLRTVLIVLAIFVVGATLFAGGMYFARTRTNSFNWGYGPGMMGGYANPNYDQYAVSPKYFSELFRRQGITVVNNFTYTSPDHKFSSTLNRFLDKLGIPLGPTIIIQGKV